MDFWDYVEDTYTKCGKAALKERGGKGKSQAKGRDRKQASG